MTAGEVIQSLARAPFDTPVLIQWSQGDGVRFNIAQIVLSTEGQDAWEVVVEPNLSASA